MFQNTKSYLQTDTEKYTLCMHHSVRILLGRLWKSVTKQRHRVSCLLIWEPRRIFLIGYPWGNTSGSAYSTAIPSPLLSCHLLQHRLKNVKTQFLSLLCSKEGHVTILWPVSCNLKSPSTFLIKSLIIGTNSPLLSALNMEQQEPIRNHEGKARRMATRLLALLSCWTLAWTFLPLDFLYEKK